MRRKGFTLIELLVVIAIIAILAAILFPVFSQARKRAQYAACISNMKQVTMGIIMYANDWNNYGPSYGDGSGWYEAISPYTKHHGYLNDGSPDPLLTCPSAMSRYGPVRYSIMVNLANGRASWGDWSATPHHVTWTLPEPDSNNPVADAVLYESYFVEYCYRWYARNPADPGAIWDHDPNGGAVIAADQAHAGKNNLGFADGHVGQIAGSGW